MNDLVLNSLVFHDGNNPRYLLKLLSGSGLNKQKIQNTSADKKASLNYSEASDLEVTKPHWDLPKTAAELALRRRYENREPAPGFPVIELLTPPQHKPQ